MKAASCGRELDVLQCSNSENWGKQRKGERQNLQGRATAVGGARCRHEMVPVGTLQECTQLKDAEKARMGAC
jgi:hypothetical protein